MKFSVIIPSYNQGRFLTETIQSVLDQRVKSELIIIDGGSSDNSMEVIESFGDLINYWVSEPDNGQSHAINKGFAKATGDIVAWLNSDDLYTEGALAMVTELFEAHPEVDCIHGEGIIFGNGKTIIQGMEAGFENEQRLAGMPSPQPSLFLRKRMLDKVGGVNEGLSYGMDYDFFLRIALCGRIQYQDGFPFSEYRIHNESKTNNQKVRFAQEWAAIFSSVLKSKGANEHIAIWQELGLYSPLTSSYDVERIGFKELEVASGLALLNVATFLNLGGDIKKAVQIIDTVKKYYRQAYDFRQVAQYDWKLRIKQHLPFIP
ncbi:MAG: glycosyltransferase family 2 protein [Flavobacteriales bacterium]